MSQNAKVKGAKPPTEREDYEVGYKKPPKEHQFKPGQSGNPKGPPVRRTQLWVYLCQYMAMTDAELEKLNREKLTQAQHTALRIVENAKNGMGCGAERLARHIFDREEGKAVEHLIVENENTLSDEECGQIRDLLKGQC
ncbi:MAG: DUF5681 domain-containing protein [Planctomycetota bacterium]